MATQRDMTLKPPCKQVLLQQNQASEPLNARGCAIESGWLSQCAQEVSQVCLPTGHLHTELTWPLANKNKDLSSAQCKGQLQVVVHLVTLRLKILRRLWSPGNSSYY